MPHEEYTMSFANILRDRKISEAIFPETLSISVTKLL